MRIMGLDNRLTLKNSLRSIAEVQLALNGKFVPNIFRGISVVMKLVASNFHWKSEGSKTHCRIIPHTNQMSLYSTVCQTRCVSAAVVIVLTEPISL